MTRHTRPVINLRAPASAHHQPRERIAEFYHSGSGGLISIRPDDTGALVVEVYGCYGNVQAVVPDYVLRRGGDPSA